MAELREGTEGGEWEKLFFVVGKGSCLVLGEAPRNIPAGIACSGVVLSGAEMSETQAWNC